MRSVADDLRLRTIARVLDMPVAARVELALSLGDDDLDLFVRSSGLERHEARRRLRAERSGGDGPRMTLIDRVVRVLNAHAVPHALIRAGALAARGIARSTFDIDLLTTDARVIGAGLWESLRAEDVTVDIRRGDGDDPLGGVVRLETAGERPVDIILGKHAWQARAVERAERPADGPPIVAARDLVLLKLYAGGSQDVWDIRELLQAPGAEQLIEDVSTDVADPPGVMLERWTEARR